MLVFLVRLYCSMMMTYHMHTFCVVCPLKGHGDGKKKKDMGQKNDFSAFACSHQFCIPLRNFAFVLQNFCVGNNMRWEKKNVKVLQANAKLLRERKRSARECKCFARKHKCFRRERNISRGNAIVLRQSANVLRKNKNKLWTNAKFLGERKGFAREF